MKRKLNFLYLVSCILCLVFCKKSSDLAIHLKGNVNDPNTKINLSSANVTVSATQIQQGIYSTTYQDIATTNTDASGNYSISFSKGQVVDYRLTVTKEKYFVQQTDVSSDNWQGGNTYTYNYSLIPQGYVRIDIVNSNPYNNNDQIVYGFTQSPGNCTDCCSSQLFTGNGMSFKASLKCITQGNTYNDFKWQYTRNNSTHGYDTNLYCKAFDTTYFKIQY